MAKNSEHNYGPFGTRPEAEANKPAAGGKLKLFAVTNPEGLTLWAWSWDSGGALAIVAKAAGFSAAPAEKPVSKEQVAGLLASLPAEERQALLAQLGATVPAEKAPAKGKK
jgi:hypothetical protein